MNPQPTRRERLLAWLDWILLEATRVAVIPVSAAKPHRNHYPTQADPLPRAKRIKGMTRSEHDRIFNKGRAAFLLANPSFRPPLFPMTRRGRKMLRRFLASPTPFIAA